MLLRTSVFAIFALVGLLGVAIGPAHAQCTGGCATEWSGGNLITLGGQPGSEFSQAYGIGDAGQAVGSSLLSAVGGGAAAA